MASTPDPAKSPAGNQTSPINDRATKLNAEMEELGRKIAEVVRESHKLLEELGSTAPPADPV